MHYQPVNPDDFTHSASIKQAIEWLQTTWSMPDLFHGMEHARTVEQLVMEHSDFANLPLRLQTVVQLAALLHDIGYASKTPAWSPDNREHIQAGLHFIVDHSAEIPCIQKYPEDLTLLLALIAHHDDTNYAYPSARSHGYVQAVDLGPFASIVNDYRKNNSHEDDLYSLLFKILCEADALAATGNSGASRTHAYSLHRGIPIGNETSLGGWQWEESAIGNIRLGIRRSLLDAISSKGQQQAIEAYHDAEQYIATVCGSMRIPYIPESLMNFDTPYIEGKLEINRYQSIEAMRTILRSVPLIGDPTVHPYAHADITARQLPISELYPIARYALKSHLQMHLRTAALLKQHYALSLFDLPGLLDFTLDGQQFRMSPPIIETSFEPALGKNASSILDGLHRIVLARQLGLTTTTVIEITNIPDDVPNIALPCAWDEVVLTDTVPPAEEKRHFRYSTFEECLSACKTDIFSQLPSPSTYRYFWYRDLSELGSAGIRPSL